MSKIYLLATNWSSSGNAKKREVKPNISMVDETVRLTLTDVESHEFMKIVFHKDDAKIIGEMISNLGLKK